MGLWGKRDDMIVHEQEPFNAEPLPAVLAEEMLTGVDSFYSRNHGPIPRVDEQDYRLTISGTVRQELQLTLSQLHSEFESQTLTATLQCAGNRRAGLIKVRDIPGEDPWGPCATSTAEWTGVRLADVLQSAGLLPQAAHVAFSAPDISQLAKPAQPYGGSIPVSKALGSEVMLAWAMNGAPLPAAHGAPLRVVVPGYIGARSVKWVHGINVQEEPSDNYFQATAYRLLPAEADPDLAGPGDGLSLSSVALNSAILQPADLARVAAGPVEVVGYAFAGDDRRIARVDVSLDGGESWVQAHLDDQQSPWAWCQWRTTVHIPVGSTHIIARAWDSSGAAQPESAVHLWNPKGYINNSWDRITVVGH